MRITNTLIAIVAVLGVTGLASTADATTAAQFAKHPVGMAALSPSAAALPFTPVDVTLGPGHRGLAVASTPYADNTTVYTSDTGGSHWTDVFSVRNLLTGAYWTNRTVQAIWVAGVADRPKPHDPQWFQPVLWHSTNGGRTWTHVIATVPRAAGFRTEGTEWTHLVWTTTRVGWATTTTGQVLATVDGGRRWALVSAFGTHAIHQIEFVNRKDGWALSASTTTASSILWHTTNGGKTWQRQRLADHVDALDFGSPTRGWAAGGTKSHGQWIRTIWSTTDSGHQWTAHDLGTVAYADEVMAGVTVSSPRVLWATSGVGLNSPPVSAVNQPLAPHLWVSDNGGRTWTSVTQPKSVSAVSLPQFVGPTAGWSLVLGALGPTAPEYLYQWQAARQQWEPVK